MCVNATDWFNIFMCWANSLFISEQIKLNTDWNTIDTLYRADHIIIMRQSLSVSNSNSFSSVSAFLHTQNIIFSCDLVYLYYPQYLNVTIIIKHFLEMNTFFLTILIIIYQYFVHIHKNVENKQTIYLGKWSRISFDFS